MVMKIKKTKKFVKQRGNTRHGHGARKKWKKSGHKGGVGMAGTGKRGDQKKTLITKLYGNKYFGKQGITSKGTARKKIKEINLITIQRNLNSLLKKYGKNNELNLKDFKVLGGGKLNKAITIIAKSFTKSAKQEIENAGGKAVLIKGEKSEKVEKEKKNRQEIIEEKSEIESKE